MDEHLEEHGYIGLFPDGVQMSDSGYYRWVTSFNDIGSRFDDGPDGPTCTSTPYPYGAYDNCPADEASRACPWGTSCADDLGFFEAMLDFAGERLTVDEDRVYMTGFSQGGQTTQGLACGLAHRLAAIAPMHGFAANGHTCGPDTALGMIQFSGTRDTIVPEDGVSDGGLIYDHADETAQEWAAAQGCDADLTPYPTAYDGVEGMVCMQHAGCDTGASVVWCRWDGSHSWPRNSSDGNFGLETLWSFFEAHHR
jgi:poly(3-hydroxybutyrate) depolymerase